MSKALISVSDKTGLIELAQAFNTFGVEIISTGGTLKTLINAKITASQVFTYTGAPEIMDGRVKTLHPKIFAGILHRRHVEQDTVEMAGAGYGDGHIDFVIVNLYPFKETVAKPDVTEAEATENIDIGGPSLVRAGAKNSEWVTVVVDPNDYPALIAEMQANNGQTTHAFRTRMRNKAFAHTRDYDTAIASYFER